MSRMRLADYFAVVGFNFDKKRNGEDLAGEGKILERFPAKDWRELTFPDDALSLFCQPNGWRLRTKAEVFRSPPTICTTVFTDAIGGRAYGVFLTFYEPVERDQYLRPFFDMEAPEPGARRMSVRTSELYAPKTLAVLSHLPVLDCLKTSLSILYTAFVERKCELLDLLVGNMLRWQTAELDGSVRFKMGFGDIQPVQIPQCDAIPTSSDYTVALFEHLGIKNVLTLFVALLCGERVLLVSRAYSRLFGAAQALVSLLYPFEYAYTLLPLVPAQLVPTLVDNPTPFLYGIHESLIPLIPDPDESFRSLVVVNLDTCSVTLPEKSTYDGEDDGEGELPPIPDVLLAKLTHALIRILQPDLELADCALPPSGSDTDGDSRRQLSDSVSTESGLATAQGNSSIRATGPAATEDRRSRSIGKRTASTTNNSTNGSPQRSIPTTLNTRRSRTFLDKRIRAVFVRFFAELLIGYRSALIVVRMLPEPLITFDRVAFLAARKRLGCKFFEAVLNSCLFQLFIQKRGRPFRPRDLFDEAYADILDRVKLECSGRYSLRTSHIDDVLPVAIGGASSPIAIDLEAAPPDSVSLEHVDAIADRLHRNEFGDAPGAQQLIRRIPEFTRNFTHTSRFPPLNASKIESIIADSARLHVEPAARTNFIGESFNEQAQVIEIGPNPEEYSGSAVLDRHEQRANVESRLAVLQRCIDYIFDHQISDALKVFPAVLGTLQTPRGRLALARKLQHKVEEREYSAEKAGSDKANIVKGKVDDAQFDLISRLLNVALRADSATDEFGVAYRMMPVARAIFKPMGASHCQLYVCKQIQEYPVWRNAQFWETALYKDIESHLHSDYLKRARTDPRFASFLPEAKLTGKANAGQSEERRGEVLKLFTELHRWRDAVLRLTAEVIRQRERFDDEELKMLAKDEELLIWGHINAYIDTILDYLVPVRFADATSGDTERRNAAACTVTPMRPMPDDSAASLHDVDTSLLFTDDAAARAIQIRAVRFIKQFIDHAQQTLCRGGDRYASRDSPNTYRAMVDARVRAHMDTMLETREVLDRLPTVQPARVVKPVLLVGEQIVTELRCYLLADARDAPLFDGDFVPTSLTASFLERSNGARSCVVSDYYDAEAGGGARDSEVQCDAVARIEEKRPPIGDQSRPATAYVPAAGALFLTNYRVIFKGSPCEQIAACHTVSRAFAISALVSHKHAEPAAFGFAHAPTGCVHDALHLRSTHGAFVMRVAFDATVSTDAVRTFREQLTARRKAKCLLTVFAVTANFADCQLVDVASGSARALGPSDSGVKQRTLMQRARQTATKMVVNPFKTKKTPIRGVLVHRAADQTHLDPLAFTTSGFARGTPTYSSSVSTSASALRRVLHPVDETASAQADSDVDEDEPDVTDQRSVAESDVRGASVANDDNVSTAISVGEVDVSVERHTKHASPSTSSSQIVPDARSIVTTFTNASATVSLTDAASGAFFDPNVLLRAFNDEFSAYADYVRLGFTLQATNNVGTASLASSGPQLQITGTSNGAPAQPPSALSILKQSITTAATGPLSRSLRLTLENARHTLCTSYPAVLIVPSAVTDDGLRKFAKTHAENRFPTVVWRHPRNLALLLRGSAFTAKSFASVLKQATPAYAGVSGAPISREDLSAAGVSSTRDAEQEKFFNALFNATPGTCCEESEQVPSEVTSLTTSESADSLRDSDMNAVSADSNGQRDLGETERDETGLNASGKLVETTGSTMPSVSQSYSECDAAATKPRPSSVKPSNTIGMSASRFRHRRSLTPIDSDEEEENVRPPVATEKQGHDDPLTEIAAPIAPAESSVMSAPATPSQNSTRANVRTQPVKLVRASSAASTPRRTVSRMASNAHQKIRRFGSAAVRRAITIPRAFDRNAYEFMRERSQRPLLDAAGSPDSFRRRATPSNLSAHDPYASNANFRKVTKPRSGGDSSTPTLSSRGLDANGMPASPEVLVANTAKMIAQRVSVAKVYVLIDKDAKQPSRTDAFAQCEFIEVEHHDARELRDAYQRLMEACAPFSVSPNANDDESFMSRVAESGWLRQVQNVLRLAGLVVDLLDAQDSSVVLCLESGWEVTAQVVSIAELLLDPFYRTVRGFAVLVEKEWAAYGHRFSHRHKQTTLDAGIAPFFLQFLDCVNQIREQFPLSFEFNEYFLRFIAHHAFSSRFVDFLYDSEAERQASGLLLARQTTELLNSQDSFVTITESAADGSLSARGRSVSAHTRATPANGDAQRVSNATSGNNANNASSPVHASQFVRFASIWRYIDYYNRHSCIFSNCLYDASRWIGSGFNDGAVLRPQTSMPRLIIWNYFTEQDMFVGASLYDPELSCVELLNSFSAQNAVDDSVYLVPEDLERAFGIHSANEDEMEAFGVGTSVGSSPVDSAVQSGASSVTASTQKVPASTGTLKGATGKDDATNTAAAAVSTVMIRSVSRKPDFGSLTTTSKQRITVQLAYESGASAVPSAFALLHLLTQWRTMMDRNVTSDSDDSQLEADETVRSTFLAETASQVNKGRLLPLPRCTALVALPATASGSLGTDQAGYRATTQLICNVDNTIRPIWSVWWAALADRYRGMQQSCASSPLNGMLATQLMGKGEVAFFRNLSLRAHRLDSITLIVQGVQRSGANILKDNYVLRSKLQAELNQILKSPRPSAVQKVETAASQNGATDTALRVMKDVDTGSARSSPTPIGTQSPRITAAVSPARTVTYESDRRPPVPPRPSPGAMTLASLRTAFGSHLFKQGQVFRKWERHYFILDVPKRVVWQFESREEALFENRFSEKWIELNEVSEVHALDEVRNPPRNAIRGGFFAVNTKFRNYSFLADDEGTAREWITRLSALCLQKPST